MTTKKILVATDFSEASERALAMVKQLKPALDAQVKVVHIHLDPYEGFEHLPKDSLFGSTKQYEAYMLGLQTLLQKTATEVFGSDDSVSTEMLRGRPAEQIMDAAKQMNADLICVGATGKGTVERVLLGSVTQSLIRKSDIPVLTVR